MTQYTIEIEQESFTAEISSVFPAFTNLTDTPSSYSGQSGKTLTVNGTEDGVEFSDAGAGDMTKAVYDTNDNGIVDNSSALEGQAGSYYLDRTNHTGTQLAATISDFDTEVSNNASVTANTAKVGVTTQISNVVEDTTPQLGGELDAQANSIGFTLQTATGDGTTTIDWRNGNKFKFTFGAFNETFTFTAPSKPGSVQLIMVQDGVGSRTATWPASVKWPGGTAPTLSTAAGSIDIISFLYDGTNYYGVGSLDFQ